MKLAATLQSFSSYSQTNVHDFSHYILHCAVSVMRFIQINNIIVVTLRLARQKYPKYFSSQMRQMKRKRKNEKIQIKYK